jgi:hypothetical protein
MMGAALVLVLWHISGCGDSGNEGDEGESVVTDTGRQR